MRFILNKRPQHLPPGGVFHLAMNHDLTMETIFSLSAPVAKNTFRTLLALGILANTTSHAADDGQLAPLTVVGSKDRTLELVGSAAYLDSEDIEQQNYSNINRLLAKVPGVYTREEDGFGLFPNLSIRGNLGTRSEKTTIMEDGILMAPAPYSSPGAYYSPNAGRMNAFEILKGSSQVKYGPHTTGGVINYLSTPVPEEELFRGKFSYGSDQTFSAHAYYGDAFDTEHGRFGYLLEMYYQRSDGFRNIQGHGGRDTGFERMEPMLKVFWEPDTLLKQRLEFKYGYTDFDANESYLGLSEADVRSHPYDRYAASMYDNIGAFQNRAYLRYTAEPSPDFNLEATAYYNRFNRNWYKLSKIQGASPHAALLVPTGVTSLRGLTAGDPIEVKANNREYHSYGAELAATYDFVTGALDHSITGGVRLHKDRERRFQWVDTYKSDGMGDFTPDTQGVHGSDSNRRQETVATAIFVEDEIKTGRWTFRPGVRYEHLEFDYDDYNKGISRSDDLNVWAGGVGFSYELCTTDRIFGGVFRGISTPGPKGYTEPLPEDQTDEETSLSYELGWRHADADNHRSFELVGFFTDFDNLLAPATGTGVGDAANGGAAEVYGIEAMLTCDPASASGQAYRLPMYLSATWTRATLENNLATDPENIFTDFQDGDEKGKDIPYIPEWKLAAGVGVDMTRWGANLDITWTSSMYGTAGNYNKPVSSSREGKIDDALQVDLSGWYQVNDYWKLIAGIYNVFDEQNIVSRLPDGPRNGRGRHLYAGFEVEF